MKNALVYSCVLLLLSCGGKTGGTSQSSSTNQETQENALSEKTTAISEAFSMDFYKGSDWIIPDTLSESLLKEPEASSLKVYDSDSICRKQVDGVERCFYKDSLMNGAYKHFYFRSTDSFVSEPYYSVVVYKDGIKNDTVRHYSISSHCMTSRIITLDSICELYLLEDQRPTWTTINSWKANSPLQSSGLLGPVEIQVVDYELVN